MGNNESSKYVPRYPDGFNEKHTEIDHGLSYFKNELDSASRSGKSSGIRERAANRKKLKGYEMGIQDMAKQRVDVMSKKSSSFRDEDFERWNEMIEELTKLYQECKGLLENSARRTAKKPKDEGMAADDFLRGDGGGKGKTQESSGPALRTGKMSEQEKQAMSEINRKEDIMDDLADQITENMEFLQMRAEMIGEEIDSQKDLVEEVNHRANRTKDRTHALNEDIALTMEKDGMQKEQKKKKEDGKDMKTKMMGAMVKGLVK